MFHFARNDQPLVGGAAQDGAVFKLRLREKAIFFDTVSTECRKSVRLESGTEAHCLEWVE